MAGVGYISVSTSTALQMTHRLNRRSSFYVKLNGRAIRLRRCIYPPLANPYALPRQRLTIVGIKSAALFRRCRCNQTNQIVRNTGGAEQFLWGDIAVKRR